MGISVGAERSSRTFDYSTSTVKLARRRCLSRALNRCSIFCCRRGVFFPHDLAESCHGLLVQELAAEVQEGDLCFRAYHVCRCRQENGLIYEISTGSCMSAAGIALLVLMNLFLKIQMPVDRIARCRVLSSSSPLVSVLGAVYPTQNVLRSLYLGELPHATNCSVWLAGLVP